MSTWLAGATGTRTGGAHARTRRADAGPRVALAAIALLAALPLVQCSDGGGGVADPGPDPGPQPGISLALGASTLTVMQGQEAGVTVTITRTGGFDGAVALVLEGTPDGVTGTFDPAPIPSGAATSTLTLTVSIGAQPGDRDLIVRVSGQGVEAQTASLALRVSAAPAAEGVDWSFCPSGAPIWLAYQDGEGPWTELETAPGTTATLPIESHGGVAFVTSQTAPRVLRVIYATAAELETLGSDWCGAFGGEKGVVADVAGLAGSDHARVVLGRSARMVDASQPSFTLLRVPDGPRDLIASRVRTVGSGDETAHVADRFIFRRGLDPAHGSTLPGLDFDGAEAFEPVSRNVEIGNLGGGRAQVEVVYATANGTFGHLLVDRQSYATTRSFPAVPADRQQEGDLHMLVVSTVGAQSAARTVWLFFRDATDHAVELGPGLVVPTATTLATSPYIRIRAQFARQPEYLEEASVHFFQPGRSVLVHATAGYFGGPPATWDLAIPDLTGAGFDPGWAPQPGGQSDFWAVNAYGWEGGGVPMAAPFEGLVLRHGTHFQAFP